MKATKTLHDLGQSIWLDNITRELLTSGFWETTVHPVLLQKGGRFLSFNELVMLHKKRFSWRLFAAQRFIYSRYYAGLRFGDPRAMALLSLLAVFRLSVRGFTNRELRSHLLDRFRTQSGHKNPDAAARRQLEFVYYALLLVVILAVALGIGAADVGNVADGLDGVEPAQVERRRGRPDGCGPVPARRRGPTRTALS